MSKLITQIRKRLSDPTGKTLDEAGVLRGYWLVRESDGERFYICENVSENYLNRVAKTVLTDNNFQYWIDYCHGLDVHGRPAWNNLDCTEQFI